MPRRGENIYKRKDGRWEGRYIRSRSTAGKAIYGYVYARTYKEAKEKLIYRDKLDQYRDNESLWKQFGFGYNLITAREHRLGTLKTEYPFIRYITVCQSQTGSTP